MPVRGIHVARKRDLRRSASGFPGARLPSRGGKYELHKKLHWKKSKNHQDLPILRSSVLGPRKRTQHSSRQLRGTLE